jgi:septum formation topological specificity factor MinE
MIQSARDERTAAILVETARQLEHWRLALERLAAPETLASPASWQLLEHYLGVALRASIDTATERLRRRIAVLAAGLDRAGPDDLDRLRAELLAIRQHYLRVETMIEFYADALATRATEPLGSWLRACDHLAARAMAEILTPLGLQVPAVLTFADKGAGAAIWKMGLRLWDGTVENPIAVIKVTRHNLLRPTATLHEAGHQIAHVLGWNDELRAALASDLQPSLGPLAQVWAGWASEIAGDAIAFCHTGFGAVSALHDVVDGPDEAVFFVMPGDPHPVAHLRVLLGVAMCRRAFGPGRWDRLADAWNDVHPGAAADAGTRELIERSGPVLDQIVGVTLYRPYRAFGGRSLADVIDPRRVSPAALEQLERDIGEGGLHSRHWIWDEAIRILALTSYRATRDAASLREAVRQQDAVMRRLGLKRAA